MTTPWEPKSLGEPLEPLPGGQTERLRPAVNWRSLLVGMAGVVLICALTPYNDYVVDNTPMIGNFLPIGLLLFYSLFITAVNAPLRLLKPRWALDGRELSVALAMTLVGCALPSLGLMRYLPGHLITVFHATTANNEFLKLMRRLDLPDWMFPRFHSRDPLERANDPVAVNFVGRTPVDSDSWRAHWLAVPWAAWARPALSWGLFLCALYGAIICLSLVFRRQWTDNERLAFPLAGVYLALVESPEPGRAFNSLFRSRGFWITFGIVFLIHACNAMAVYLPRYVPTIPMSYDLISLMSQPPLSSIEPAFKLQTIYFTVIGIAFFLPSQVAFSLWFVFLIVQVVQMGYGQFQSGMSWAIKTDQAFGATIAYGIGILWVARHHLRMVAAQMFRGARYGEESGRYLPHAAAGWGLLICLSALALWLRLAGASTAGALMLVAMLVLFYVVIMRIVAETGIIYVELPMPLTRPWLLLGNSLPGGASVLTTDRSYFWTAFLSGVLTDDMRESPAVFINHAFRVADSGAYPGKTPWRKGLPMVLSIVLALAVAYVVAGAAMLYVEYNYSATLSTPSVSPINAWGADVLPRIRALQTTTEYLRPVPGPLEPHNRLGYLAAGAVITAALGILRLRFVNFPIHPVGYLLVYTWGLNMVWFSIFLGWLLKTLVVRLGGASLFRRARGVFMGMILGEAGAAACWMIVSLVRASMGLDYKAIHLLPH